MPDWKVEQTYRECKRHLRRIRQLFKKGVLVTLIIRTPDRADCDLCLTDESVLSMEDLAQMVQRTKERMESQ